MTLTWPDAEDYCKKKSGHLASVTSNAINDYVVEGRNKRGINRLWIGGSDSEAEGTWRWADCSPWEFSLWKRGEPNGKWGAQNCLNYYDLDISRWDDQECKNPERFLCSQNICSDEDDTSSTVGLCKCAWKRTCLNEKGFRLFLIAA